ncbi:MAG TPA: RelA/SpoT family protein [Bacilli bacterium]|nr:RelA/SpoT family protein [Bacilli bacterium]HPZ23683.1 RelA/SpoT family protein [Bacilli bacterium]HQC83434.1 RelA/SpoT family protein [Bacilli bacterium]
MKNIKELYLELMDKCDENGYSEAEIDKINKAYEYACEQHKGMVRKNGEEYIVHPLNVALIVASLNVDADTIVSALVHETVDHGSSSFEELGNLFGEDVKNITISLTKVNRLHLIDDSESSSLYLRKVLVALAQDVRVLILKLAGRIHNLRTVDGLDPDLQKQKAKETEAVLIPIAHRLGINSLKAELEDLSFKILRPDIYNQIESELPEPREDLNDLLNATMDEISDLLHSQGLNFEIKCRVKSVSSISNKLSSGHTWNNIYDILGIRVICEEIPDCYLIIGTIHSKYRPIPKRFKDYIAMPKGNSYQSLHTGIYGPNNYPIEVQVRTKEMDEIAEHGIASHWSYKEHGTKQAQNVMEQKLQMFRNTIEISSKDINDEDFINNVSSELLSKSIYVNTPKGDVVELPQDSTPIDFAYRIHSGVGDTTVGCIVNGNIVTLDYKLQDGDVVSIKTDSNSTPNKDWLTFVKTTQAKSKIKSFFSKIDKDEYIKHGKELLEHELRRQKISITDAMSTEHQRKLMSDLGAGTFDEVLLQIGSLRYTPVYIVNLLYNDKRNAPDVLLDKVINNTNIQKENYKADIIVSGNDDILVNLASCCKPVYGDEIIGYITKGHGITVHRKDCINVKGINDRLINVEWNKHTKEDNKKYTAKLKVYTNEIKADLIALVTKASTHNVVLTSINENNGNNVTYYDILARVEDVNSLNTFIDDIKTLDFVTGVRRL